MVPKEYYILKDLLFYEETCETDTKARQERFNQREEIRQEGTLRRALGENGRASSSTAYPPVKKKKSSAKSVKALVSAPASPSISTLFASTLVDSFVPASKGDLDPPDFKRSDLGISHFEPEPEPIERNVINEPEVEKGMATGLRANFKERHRKCLHEAITIDTPPAKRTCLKGVQEEPMRDASSVLVPSQDTTNSINMPAVEKETGPA